MDINLDDVQVENNEADEQFEAKIDEYVALAAYQRAGDRIVFTHTEVPPELEGQGLAGKIVHEALEYARQEHLTVVPHCSYVAGYIRRHPEYQSLVQQA